MNATIAIKLFLRIAIAATFLSAVADRVGWWSADVAVWGNWATFVEYTALINPWMPEAVIPVVAVVVTIAEILLSVCLLVGWRVALAAQLSGALLLLFALSMTFATGIKGPLDYSVFIASAGAFSLSLIKAQCLELDRRV